jgi:hypothetical protein
MKIINSNNLLVGGRSAVLLVVALHVHETRASLPARVVEATTGQFVNASG